MTGNSCTLAVTYNVASGDFTISGDVKKERQVDFLSEFLSTQLGAGEDTSKANEQDIYHVSIEWFPENDRFVVSSDTGNLGLRDGILMDVAKRLRKKTS